MLDSRSEIDTTTPQHVEDGESPSRYPLLRSLSALRAFGTHSHDKFYDDEKHNFYFLISPVGEKSLNVHFSRISSVFQLLFFSTKQSIDRRVQSACNSDANLFIANSATLNLSSQ